MGMVMAKGPFSDATSSKTPNGGDRANNWVCTALSALIIGTQPWPPHKYCGLLQSDSSCISRSGIAVRLADCAVIVSDYPPDCALSCPGFCAPCGKALGKKLLLRVVGAGGGA